MLSTMPRLWPPPDWCRARDGSPGRRPAPGGPPGLEPSVAEREALVPHLDWLTPPLLPSPRTSVTSAQHSGSSNSDTSPVAAPRVQFEQCARCGLVARPEHLQFRSGSWLCGFHFAVGDLEAEPSSLGQYHDRRTRITNVIKAARDLCRTPIGEPERFPNVERMEAP